MIVALRSIRALAWPRTWCRATGPNCASRPEREARMTPGKFGVGQSVRRQEDDPLLRGGGRYVADHHPAGCLHAVMVRSPHAHARFRLETATARALPGVRLVLTAE